MSRRQRVQPPAAGAGSDVSCETEALRAATREAHETVQSLREERRAIRRERDELVKLVKDAQVALEKIVARDLQSWGLVEQEARQKHQDSIRQYWQHVADASSAELVASLTEARDAVLEQLSRAVTLALRAIDPGHANGNFKVALVAAPSEARAFTAPAGAVVRPGMTMHWEDEPAPAAVSRETKGPR